MRRLLLAPLLFLIGTPCALARFQQDDARAVDREERQDRATWHDGGVYRYYPRLQELWRARDLGFRISDGSYDADRSRIQEQLKVTTDPDAALVLAYKRERLHDLADEIIDNEMRFTARLGDFYGAVLADGETSFKQWGDLGVALGWRGRRRLEIDLYAWSVDHFYQSKQEVDFGNYETKPRTYGAHLVLDRDAGTGLELRYEVDTPFTWTRTFFGAATDYSYRYAHSRLDLDGRLELAPGWQLLATAVADVKQESKTFTPDGAMPYTKKLNKRSQHLDLSVLRRYDDGDSDQLGVTHILRRGEASFTQGPTPEAVEEEPSPDSSRREGQAYLFHQFRLAPPNDSSQGQFLQLGYVQSWARHDFSGFAEHGVDQKFQLAFELYFAKAAGVFLNATLDLDGIREDWPFDRGSTPGNLWDGGGVQFFALF